jgi:thioredoxin reductase (NADPH)
MYNLVIVGTGPAGLTAAIYGARAGLKPIVYAGLQHGGQLTTTTEVENFPGFSKGIMGPELMKEMTEQAVRVGAEIKYSYITKVDFSGSSFKLWADKEEIEAKSVILSTGATARTLGLANEAKLMGRGISTCATCDGFFYRNKTVAVVGGGDSAMEEALYLANLCKEVVLLHRRDVFKASEIMLSRARKHKNIRFMLPYTVAETKFNDTGLTSLIVENTENQELQELVVDGLFYAIGHTPNSELFLPYVDLDEHGYIKVKNYTETKTPGIFAAGDIADPVFKQAITAAGLGCQAAIQAAKYIENLEA